MIFYIHIIVHTSLILFALSSRAFHRKEVSAVRTPRNKYSHVFHMITQLSPDSPSMRVTSSAPMVRRPDFLPPSCTINTPALSGSSSATRSCLWGEMTRLSRHGACGLKNGVRTFASAPRWRASVWQPHRWNGDLCLGAKPAVVSKTNRYLSRERTNRL